MSVFADHWPGFSFRPFDSESSNLLHGRNFDQFYSDFEDFSLNGDLFDMKLKGGPTLVDRGFYEHFDSIFHEGGRRRYDVRKEEQSRSASEISGRGKEYIIPIKIEYVPATDSLSAGKTLSLSKPANQSSISKSQPSVGRVIELPIVRESSKNDRNPPSIGVQEKFTAPSHFKLLTPTTDEYNRNKFGPHSSNRSIIYLDDKDSFTDKTTQELPLKKPLLSTNVVSDNDIITLKEEEQTTVINSLRRKPLRHISDSPSVSSEVSTPRLYQSRSQQKSPFHSDSATHFETGSHRGSSSSQENVIVIDDVIATKNDVRSHECVTKKEEKEETSSAAVERLRNCCSTVRSPLTTPPNYPIYDHLQPMLASCNRGVDYIRGDGNCFFRAISKDVYGSENYHAEWREAVVDIIERNPDVFRQYMDTSDVAEHVRDMRKPGTWATTCEIYAAATLLQREIYVLAPTHRGNQYHWLLFSPRVVASTQAGESVAQTSRRRPVRTPADSAYPCYVTLCHTNGNHYDRIAPLFERCNCQMSTPNLDGETFLADLTQDDCV